MNRPILSQIIESEYYSIIDGRLHEGISKKSFKAKVTKLYLDGRYKSGYVELLEDANFNGISFRKGLSMPYDVLYDENWNPIDNTGKVIKINIGIRERAGQEADYGNDGATEYYCVIEKLRLSK